MTENMPVPLRVAWQAACAARDAALAAPLVEPFSITNEWRVLVSRIDDAQTLVEKITAAEHAEAAMNRRAMPGASTIPHSDQPPVDFFRHTAGPPPRCNSAARRAARRRELFVGATA
jgi:hypothetical protein